jgi:hypothetical protein
MENGDGMTKLVLEQARDFKRSFFASGKKPGKNESAFGNSFFACAQKTWEKGCC